MKKPSKKSEIEFCTVCRFHHDQGSRHKYFPRHKSSLSSLLDRFRSKIADVRFFLKNPSVLRPQEQSQNRVWCVFCDEDIVELGSSFAWYAIPFSLSSRFVTVCLNWVHCCANISSCVTLFESRIRVRKS
ncbi:TTL [Arabidopsis thaliana]|uniref:TTL n=1 Tax=Arabidopsis thaliana TaxID=3702 RepID=A0A178UZV7_ARATH|nr:TTL [Arabidopsis thaliana]